MDLVTLAMAKKYTNEAIKEAATGEVDLSAYATTSYVDGKVAGIVESAPDTLNTLNELAAALGDDPNFATTIATQIGGKVDKVSGKGLSTNDFTAAYKNKVDAAVPNTLTVNGKALKSNITLSASDVKALPDTTTIPTSLASLTEDSTHRVVTDTEKTAWNAKSNFSGNYNDLTNKPTIPSIAGLATTDYVDSAVANIILTSESGNKFKLTVTDDGTLTATAVTE